MSPQTYAKCASRLSGGRGFSIPSRDHYVNAQPQIAFPISLSSSAVNRVSHQP